MSKVKVYIASAYTIGDVAINVKAQIDAVDQLISAGFVPFAPLYSHFQHMAHPRPYGDWVEQDNEWVPVCDCVLRLRGESKGADAEVELARKLGKPIFYTVDSLVKHYEKKRAFIICSVRGMDDEYREMLEQYVKKLEDDGWSVHLPHRDTKQDATGLEICTQNANSIRKADVVHVFYSEKSTGTHFDMGVAFALNKNIVFVNDTGQTPQKSFINMLREWRDKQ